MGPSACDSAVASKHGSNTQILMDPPDFYIGNSCYVGRHMATVLYGLQEFLLNSKDDKHLCGERVQNFIEEKEGDNTLDKKAQHGGSQDKKQQRAKQEQEQNNLCVLIIIAIILCCHLHRRI